MKQKILLTNETYKPLSNEARKTKLTADELAEIYIKRGLKLK
tara:strand:+ start:6632 stop:6757 length:126 start_codon:yes stop_codon:yes gene_type:complete